MSLVKESLLPWGIYAGIPSHLKKKKKKEAGVTKELYDFLKEGGKL